MDIRTYNNQDVTAYLLGSLPDAEAELFDELSFTDDVFADTLKSAEKDLVDAYVHGELASETLEKFNTFYLASPIRREKVNFAKAFQVYAEKSAAELPRETTAALQTQPKTAPKKFFSSLNIFSTSRPLLQWGFAAAALLFMILGGWILIENSRLKDQFNNSQANSRELQQRQTELQQREQQLQEEISGQRNITSEKEEELTRIRGELSQLEKIREQNRKRLSEQQQEQKRLAELSPNVKQSSGSAPNKPVIASFVLVPQLRGTNDIATLSIPAQLDIALLKLELEPNDFKVFRAVLQSQTDNKTIWQSGKVKARSQGEIKILNLNLPSKLLKTQTYSLVVSGINANGEAEIISNYPFRAVLK